MRNKKNEYEKLNNKLKERKQKLLEDKKTEDWELPVELYKTYNIEELVKSNKDGLMNLMLPKETKESYEALATYGYYLNKLIEESQRISTRDYCQLRKVFINYASSQSGIVKSVDCSVMLGGNEVGGSG